MLLRPQFVTQPRFEARQRQTKGAEALAGLVKAAEAVGSDRPEKRHDLFIYASSANTLGVVALDAYVDALRASPFHVVVY